MIRSPRPGELPTGKRRGPPCAIRHHKPQCVENRPVSARHCFTYGTLMCEDIMAAVCGRPFVGEPATLHGFTRHPVAGTAYPGIVRDAGALVHGRLYRDVGHDAFVHLDAFEGEQYERRTVNVRLADGGRLRAEAYVFRDACVHLLRPGAWDFVAFVAQDKAGFIDACMRPSGR